MNEPTDHRAQAERWVAEFLDSIAPADPNRQDMLRLAHIHALLAQDRDRCTATRDHANGHHWPAEPDDRPVASAAQLDALAAEFGGFEPRDDD